MDTSLPVWFEIIALVVLLAILAMDLVLAYRRPHVPSALESGVWVGIYAALACVFAVILATFGGGEQAGEFVAGWLTEYSLSIDNLFVFVIIMTRLAVPRAYQHEALMVGIVIALVMRGIFILLGAQLIENFSWIFYFFGAFLLYTAVRQAIGTEGGGDKDNAVVRFARRHLNISSEYDGGKVRTVVDGRRMFTPMVIVFVSLGMTDLLFALDSIPAIFGITTDPFLVFSANVFALLGLRQLYFLLGHLLERLEYLKYGIGVILFFIGVKLVFHALHVNEVPFINGGEPVSWVPEIDTLTSLMVIVVTMIVATIASLVRLRVVNRKRISNQ